MLNCVYDNCEKIIGNVKNVKQYVENNCEDYEEVKDMIEELKNFEENTIVLLDYNNGMGFTIDYWTEKDKQELFQEES